MAEALEEGVEQWEVRLGSGRQGPYQSLADNRKKFRFNSVCRGNPLEVFKQRSNMIIYVLKRFWKLCREWTEAFKSRNRESN